MTVNIETDIDLNIKKVDELLERMKQLEDKSQMIRFIRCIRICDYQELQY